MISFYMIIIIYNYLNIILRPDEAFQIDSFEKDLKKIDRLYHYGYQLALEHLDEIQKILE